MLLLGQRRRTLPPQFPLRRRLQQSSVTALPVRTPWEVSPKRDHWTEADVAALPAGEHDYFDRKSGRLFDGDRGDLLGTIAKALAAFSNSGGGHLVLGVADNGSFDGVPRTIKGRTTTREWLEQKIPTSWRRPCRLPSPCGRTRRGRQQHPG
jgi:hypothetical protein